MDKNLDYYMSLPYRVDVIPIPEPEGFDLYGLLQDGLADVANGNTSPLSEAIKRIRQGHAAGIQFRHPRGG